MQGIEGEMEMNEKWYDEEIAPMLLKLGKKCEKKKMSFLAVVEYAAGERATTKTLSPSASLEMVMVAHCIKTAPNIDGYVIGLSRYLKEKGIDFSSSIVLTQWGK